MSFRILILTLTFVFISSCKDQPNEITEIIEVEEIPNVNSKSLNGTWELVSFYNYKDNVVVDSFDTSSNSRQLKMYTDSKVMWCKHKPADSSEWFGYGTYNFKDNTLTEVLDFGSAVMDNVISEKKQFKFELQLQPNQFQQIELDDDGNRIYSENYKRIE
ncbi:hypothetical protein DFQ10_107210 [Winogradskyella eximia]|jgi:hypothetical protein|uniref:Lipocalin-like protein n=1 Tax=Winogradskyella eximia TaxID=262006 RepID=A0A3D9H0I1_9FLAO|nr:hypothetical protein [Winogradskyella eximia]RED43022.1 hypothetical protein DFQ10_107210 [Winogradskyella eximia]